jgi:hypothetical protein
MAKTTKIGRHAGTGEFISVEKAKRLGDRAVVETIRREPPKKDPPPKPPKPRKGK